MHLRNRSKITGTGRPVEIDSHWAVVMVCALADLFTRTGRMVFGLRMILFDGCRCSDIATFAQVRCHGRRMQSGQNDR